MLDLAQAIPAKEEQPDEGRLEKEGHEALDRERRAEDVADVVRIIAPIRAELELHRDPGRDAHREIDAEQGSPKFRGVAPYRAARHHIDALHDGEQQREAERER